MRRILIVVIGVVLVVGTALLFSSCGKSPEMKKSLERHKEAKEAVAVAEVDESSIGLESRLGKTGRTKVKTACYDKKGAILAKLPAGWPVKMASELKTVKLDPGWEPMIWIVPAHRETLDFVDMQQVLVSPRNILWDDEKPTALSPATVEVKKEEPAPEKKEEPKAVAKAPAKKTAPVKTAATEALVVKKRPKRLTAEVAPAPTTSLVVTPVAVGQTLWISLFPHKLAGLADRTKEIRVPNGVYAVWGDRRFAYLQYFTDECLSFGPEGANYRHTDQKFIDHLPIPEKPHGSLIASLGGQWQFIGGSKVIVQICGNKIGFSTNMPFNWSKEGGERPADDHFAKNIGFLKIGMTRLS